ncbi:ArsR/SmtB family transcription factor [Streptacidiphilus carbonis]|jgi:ArsR family transcriptional regulator, arsenate/arsenite/antimonite-responsive transcriptional repressor|uniref:ArsR/SmtB family transcription factor n=1 Tax=Streptacidiphilus carbonis TaxID=105422 RepID=UPI0005A84E25|nr:metalloregulator ArsR/SmtB family transcription factor [Streptacidiphilus carbonis]
MSNLELAVLGQDDPALCCSPMVREPLGEDAAAELARMFKALADPVRLRLLSLIASHEGGEACVCDLTGPFDVSQPTISHHLKVLRDTGLVGSERRGTWVYYWVLPTALAKLSSLLRTPDAAEPAAAGGSE